MAKSINIYIFKNAVILSCILVFITLIWSKMSSASRHIDRLKAMRHRFVGKYGSALKLYIPNQKY